MVHYADDFIFAGKASSLKCWVLVETFQELAVELGMPLVEVKTEGPAPSLPFLGFFIDTESELGTILNDKVTEFICLRKLGEGNASYCIKGKISWGI